IEDNGAGFDTARVPLVSRGLAGLRFRVVSHGGRFNVTSRPGGGTTIDVQLPQRAASTVDDTVPAA
ncbi:MAG TPA: histidine kinase, partial [Burkholderiaceae bacterium]|nr:histidine kinase [Burkholderiaceae bacterium]